MAPGAHPRARPAPRLALGKHEFDTCPFIRPDSSSLLVICFARSERICFLISCPSRYELNYELSFFSPTCLWHTERVIYESLCVLPLLAPAARFFVVAKVVYFFAHLLSTRRVDPRLPNPFFLYFELFSKACSTRRQKDKVERLARSTTVAARSGRLTRRRRPERRAQLECACESRAESQSASHIFERTRLEPQLPISNIP